MAIKLLKLFLLVPFFFFSCNEIIDIDINSSDPQIVVEATIGLKEPAEVRISESISLDDNGVYPGIENATVKLIDSDGKSELLTKTTTAGKFVSNNILGEINKTYHLEIKANNKIVTSNSTIPNAVPIDSFKVTNTIYPGGGAPLRPEIPAPFYEVSVKFSDPINEKNYYRCVLYLNGIAQNRNNIYDDRFTNGKQMESFMVIYYPEMESGDKISVEFQCIDKSVYEYFKSMGNSAMGPRNSSSPANPYTNLTGSLLGYFSAHTVERREFVVLK